MTEALSPAIQSLCARLHTAAILGDVPSASALLKLEHAGIDTGARRAAIDAIGEAALGDDDAARVQAVHAMLVHGFGLLDESAAGEDLNEQAEDDAEDAEWDALEADLDALLAEDDEPAPAAEPLAEAPAAEPTPTAPAQEFVEYIEWLPDGSKVVHHEPVSYVVYDEEEDN